MKIQQNSTQITIDNSMAASLIVSIILIIAGIAMVGFGLIKPVYILSGVGLAISLLGVFLIFTSKSSHIELNKNTPSTITSKSLFKQGAQESFQLSDVTLVELDVRKNNTNNNMAGNSSSTMSSSRNNQSSLVSTIILVTKTGQRITLGSGSQTISIGGAVGAMIQDVPLKKQADQIAEFIGVEVQSSGDVGLKQMTDDISQIGRSLFGGGKPDAGSMPIESTAPIQQPQAVQPIQPQPSDNSQPPIADNSNNSDKPSS